MRLKVFLPTHVLVDEDANKVVAEDAEGLFCLLPHHCDYVSTLVPSVLSFVTPDGREKFVATDNAVLVKTGGEVRVSTSRGVVSENIEEISGMLKGEFFKVDESEEYQASEIALERLEIGIMRHFMALKE